MPKQWESRPLADLVELHSGGTPSKAVPEYWGGPIPWVTVKDMKTMRFSGTTRTLTELGATRVTIAPKGSVLVLVRGMGLFKDLPVVLCDEAAAFNQDIKSLVPRRGVDGEFLAFALISRKNTILRHVDTAGHGTGRLDTELLKSIQLPLPPLSEQRRIATILRTWDEAIDKLGRLRMAKSRRRRGVMRALLTAKLRVLGFGHRPWRVVRLGEIAEVIVSSVDKKTKSSERPVRLCNYTDVYACHTIRPRMGLMKASATSTEIEKCRLRVGDVVITKDSEDPNDIAVPAVVEETAPDLVCGYHLAIIRPGPAADGPFLKYYFDLPGTRAYFASRANGATRFGLTVGSIEGAVIRIPELAEQRRIAEVLRTCDEAIATISRQIDSVAGQKRGLQQKLTL